MSDFMNDIYVLNSNFKFCVELRVLRCLSRLFYAVIVLYILYMIYIYITHSTYLLHSAGRILALG